MYFNTAAAKKFSSLTTSGVSVTALELLLSAFSRPFVIIIKGTRLQHGVPEYLMHVANGVILGSSLQNYKKTLEN